MDRMIHQVRIAVDGEDGATVSRLGAIRLVEGPNDERSLVPFRRNIDGRHGTSAGPALPGALGGTMFINLSESQEAYGRIHAAVAHYEARQRPPGTVEVPVGYVLMLSARGGAGERGGTGGDGTDGTNGVDGVTAMRATDATPGTPAGHGGNAGSGTSGANGGSGGAISILMSEHDTHLLLALQWDVDGGQGGGAGQHGRAGKGGIGGKGGEGHTWYYPRRNTVQL